MTSTRMRALGVGAVALSGISLTAGFASSAVAASGCGTGATLVSTGICEIKFTSGSHTFTPPAGITKLDALVVGAGGAGSAYQYNNDAYGGGGGEVKVVNLAATGEVSVVVGAAGVHGTSYSAVNDSSVTQSGTTTTAQGGGNAGDDGPSGASGSRINGNWGWCIHNYCLGGGAGAGAGSVNDADHKRLGGAGLVVSAVTGASTSLFANDSECYGGGGSTSGFYHTLTPADYNETATSVCGGGAGSFTTNGSGAYVSYVMTAPRANSGSGGAALGYTNQSDTSLNVRVNQSGAAGVVILRYDAAKLPDTGMNVGGVLGLGASALLAGAAALILGRRRKA